MKSTVHLARILQLFISTKNGNGILPEIKILKRKKKKEKKAKH